MKTKSVLMWASIFWGSFLLLAWISLTYSAIWRHELLFDLNPNRFSENNTNFSQRTLNSSESRRIPVEPVTYLLSPTSIFLLLTGLLILANGLYLMHNTRKTEKSKVKDDTILQLLTSDEKEAYQIITEQEEGLTQKQLTMKTGWSPVKIHRTILRLERKNLVTSHPFGMTKKIIKT